MTDPRDEAANVGAVALLAEPTRHDLYRWVVSRGEPVGRDEAATALGIGRGLAAFHLDKLVSAGLLEVEYRRLTGRSGPGAGRPAKLYRRSDRDVELSLPSRRYGLAAEIFARALEHQSGAAEPVVEAARAKGREIGRGASATSGGSGEGQLLRALGEGGYAPEVDDDGTVRLRNCPFHALAAAHRQLTCGMNLALAEGLVEGLGAGTHRPVLDPRPGWCCVALLPGE